MCHSRAILSALRRLYVSAFDIAWIGYFSGNPFLTLPHYCAHEGVILGTPSTSRCFKRLKN